MRSGYAQQWVEYRRLCRLGIYSLVAFFSAPFIMIPTLGILLRSDKFQFLAGTRVMSVPCLIEVALLFTTAYFGWRHLTWHCPRCDEPFGRLHETCQNCGLPKWAVAEESDAKGPNDESADDSRQ